MAATPSRITAIGTPPARRLLVLAIAAHSTTQLNLTQLKTCEVNRLYTLVVIVLSLLNTDISSESEITSNLVRNLFFERKMQYKKQGNLTWIRQ